ncbi:MAG: FeoA family protein [Spirochaetota bacterium]
MHGKRGFGRRAFGRGRQCCDGSGHGRGRRIQQGTAVALHPGERAVVQGLQCHGGCRRKLLSLGIVPGKEIYCTRGNGGHGLCLRVGASEFFLNRHMAERIQVDPVSRWKAS